MVQFTGVWNVIFQIVGWIGSAFIVISLTQARVLRLRVLNLTGSAIATAWNALAGIWPFFAMNVAICIINIYWLVRMYREKDDATAYKVVDVAPDDAFLHHVLTTNASDIAKYAPGFGAAITANKAKHAFLVMKADEVIGVVIIGAAEGADYSTGVVLLDWVSEKYRNFTPGQFVYTDSKAFQQLGFYRLIAADPLPASADYLEAVGFVREGGQYVRTYATTSDFA